MSDELKPVRCGCGGRPIIEYGEDGICRVHCSFCLTGTVYHRNKAEAITAWNRAMGADQFRDLTKKVEPEQKKGKWEEREVDSMTITDYQSAKCSVCGKYLTTPYQDYFDNYKYCPHCGARLEWNEDA